MQIVFSLTIETQIFQLSLENYAIKLSLAVATLNLQKCDIKKTPCQCPAKSFPFFGVQVFHMKKKVISTLYKP